MERDALDVEPREQLRREVEPGRRRGRGAGVGGVDRLIAPRLRQRLVDVRRQRRLAVGLAVEPDAPAPLAERLEQLDRPEPLARPQPPRRPRERLPDAVAERLEEQHLGRAAALALQVEPRGDDLGVVDDDELAGELGRQIARTFDGGRRPWRGRRRAVARHPGGRQDAARSARAAGRSRARPISSDGQSSLALMDEQALERAKQRIAEARAGRERGRSVRGSAAALARGSRGARRRGTRARDVDAGADRRGGAGRHAPRGAPRRPQPRRDQGAAQQRDRPARTARAGADRRAQRAPRRPHAARRPRLDRLAGRRSPARADRAAARRPRSCRCTITSPLRRRRYELEPRGGLPRR